MLLTALTVICACVWFFPIYWALVTSFRTDDEAIKSFSLLPERPTLNSYLYILAHSKLPIFYLNSTVVSLAVTALTLAMSICAGYAISQLQFPGRRLLWWTILASFMVPVPALIVNHFIIVASVDLINTYAGIVLPLLIAPVTVIVYKQFFDSVPRDFREAAVMDGANEFQLLFRVFLPMNWGVTTALGIITFIGAWNNFLWPFLAATGRDDDDGHRRHPGGAGHVWGGLCAPSRRRRIGRPAGGGGLPALSAPRDSGHHAVGGDQGMSAGRTETAKARRMSS